MIPIENVQPLSAEALYDLLKKEFADYVNTKLDSNLTIDYAHVFDVINILFPEIIEGTAFTITISDKEINLINHTEVQVYNTELLEQHLIEFLNEKAG